MPSGDFSFFLPSFIKTGCEALENASCAFGERKDIDPDSKLTGILF